MAVWREIFGQINERKIMSFISMKKDIFETQNAIVLVIVQSHFCFILFFVSC